MCVIKPQMIPRCVFRNQLFIKDGQQNLKNSEYKIFVWISALRLYL